MDQQFNPSDGADNLRNGLISSSPAPIAPNPNRPPGNAQSMQSQNHNMLMGLMTNPTLAAAAAASPLFPPAAMLTNPGAFFAMPDVFAASAPSNTPAAPVVQAQFQHAAMMPSSMQSSHIENQTATMYADTMGNQVQHVRQGQSSGPHSLQTNSAGQLMFPGMPAGMMNNNGDSSMQAHMVAAAAAAHAVAAEEDMEGNEKKRRKDLSTEERAKQNRDRNREHARSTRLRKKAYVQKLKELVEGLHADRTEEVRQRRVAIQHLAEMQNVRRKVIRNFLQFHATNERDIRKWSTILDDECWLKQPVTPYRSFRRSEIEQDCRISRGLDAIIADAASVAVMIEGIGSRSARWMQIKRHDFFQKEEERTGTKMPPHSVRGRHGRYHQAVSSLSSSSANSSNNVSSEDDSKTKKRRAQVLAGAKLEAAKVAGESQAAKEQEQNSSEGLHDYDAKPLPDPKLQDSSERGSSSLTEDSPEESNTSLDEGKLNSTDSSSGDDSANAREATPSRPKKRMKGEVRNTEFSKSAGAAAAAAMANESTSSLPHNIAKRGGISHNIRPLGTLNTNPRLSKAPAMAIPPFTGLGNRQIPQGGSSGTLSRPRDQTTSQHAISDRRSATSSSGGMGARPVIISGDMETSSSNSSKNRPQIKAYYHMNEDDMILMEDILMCPFILRTQDAVQCGALAECVMPGMLRANFTKHNKLKSLEMTYDAMGFMQQLERASGRETGAQIIPGSLEMALSHTTSEARVITLAKPPFLIVNVNKPWTKLTKYTQMAVEGMELFKVLEGEPVEGRQSNAPYDLAPVCEGMSSCATRLHYDKNGDQFVDFMCSYPLTNMNDEITHVLHVSKEVSAHQDGIELLDSAMEEELGSSQ